MTKTLTCLLLLSITLSANATNKIVYGSDNRKDISRVINPKIKEISKSIAGRVDNFSFDESNGKISFANTDTLSSPWTRNLCSDEKFAKQKILPTCTGFLVGEDLLATAGHCILDRKSNSAMSGKNIGACPSHSWLFDYKANRRGSVKTKNITKRNIYKCSEVIEAKLNDLEDYALIRLDRKVSGRKPLKLKSSGKTRGGTKIYVIGHPSGLPMKYANGAKVFDVHNSYFSTNLDTFGGNSGSPVFNAKTNEVEGILVRGDIDYYQTFHNGQMCSRVNVCSNNRLECIENDDSINGEHVSVISRITKLLKK